MAASHPFVGPVHPLSLAYAAASAVRSSELLGHIKDADPLSNRIINLLKICTYKGRVLNVKLCAPR